MLEQDLPTPEPTLDLQREIQAELIRQEEAPSESTVTDRRTFMRRGAMGAGALWMCSLSDFAARAAFGKVLAGSPYGPVSPKFDETTGLPLLQLPDGFRYLTFGWTGDPMIDGVRTPALHDGMAVVARLAFSDRLILVRNHEPDTGMPYVTNRPDITYASDGAGGTSNVVFNARSGRFEGAWSSLAGTVRNCAGGVTPWGSWITNEETDVDGHGWSFDVGPIFGDRRPIIDMGRFSHEALMVDPRTGYIYQTEDSNPSGFYKFIPDVPGSPVLGGRLFMLRVRRQPNLALSVSGAAAHPMGSKWDVEWVRIDDPAAQTLSTYAQGAAKGGASFNRLEGAWWGDHKGYFLTTSGGAINEGQVFEYNPWNETLKLIFDSPTPLDCDNPDNITVTPRGGLLLCEDGGGGPAGPERLLGLTLDGQVFTFAVNNVILASDYNDLIEADDYTDQEFAGACYSPDGRWLFCNIQTPGITFAITGPWGKGPL
jgi:secreted PhoX family phosphatase